MATSELIKIYTKQKIIKVLSSLQIYAKFNYFYFLNSLAIINNEIGGNFKAALW